MGPNSLYTSRLAPDQQARSVSHTSNSLLNLLGTVQQARDHVVRLGEEGRVGALGGPGDGVGAEHGRHLLLDEGQQRAVVVAEEVHGLDVLPRLVRGLVPEHLRRLVLQLGDGALGEVLGDVVVEDLLGCAGVDALALVVVLVMSGIGGGIFPGVLTWKSIHGSGLPPSILIRLRPLGTTKADRKTRSTMPPSLPSALRCL